MRFEISLDEFLDDGRVVVTNSSNYGHQAGPEHSALVLSGAFNVPAKAEFTQFVSMRSLGAGTLEHIGTTSVALRIAEIEFWRKIVSNIPAGHHAVIRLEGTGMEMIRQQATSKSSDVYFFLVADNAEI